MTSVNIAGYHLSEQLYNASRTLVCRGDRQADLLPTKSLQEFLLIAIALCNALEIRHYMKMD
ncbi:MAG: hypothetical protein DSM106950_21540 [Stigonema ocellatum SAG 48.90 = DSM 106950]|nr:hypothetical protein [Stigonema ocellatum SAG 48.90 = DSM 106950]